MKCLSTLFRILPLTLGACLPTALPAAVIINGGFEQPDVSGSSGISDPSGFQNSGRWYFQSFSMNPFNRPASFSGWTVSSGNVGIFGAPFFNYAASGKQFAMFEDSPQTLLSQNVTGLGVGLTYEIKFQASVFTRVGDGLGSGGSSISLSIGGGIDTQSFAGVVASAWSDTWTEHSFTFTATAATMALNVNVTRQPSGGGSIPGLDDIRITEVIPEPSSIGLLLLGALAVNRRRRI